MSDFRGLIAPKSISDLKLGDLCRPGLWQSSGRETDRLLDFVVRYLAAVERLRQATRARGTRTRDLSSVEGDLLPGVASLSAPVFDHLDQIVATISTLGAQGGFDSKASGKIGKALKKAADELWRRLSRPASLNEQPPKAS
jgi:hypothetical protein